MSVTMQDFCLTELFLDMMTELNDGGTRNLVLRGNDLIKKVGKRIQDSDILTIIRYLTKHKEVVSLDLPYNEIGNCGLYNLMIHIQHQPTVKYLNLMCNRIEAHGIRHIVSLAENLPFFVLRLAGNKIGNEGGRIISGLLYMDIPLKILDLSDCHMTISGLVYILTGLMPNRGGSDKLEVIDISRPLEYKMLDSHVSEFFGQVLQHNKNLKEFHVQQYQLDFRDMELLVYGLMCNKSLQLLDLNNNNIGDDGVEFLCGYLRTSPPLSGLMIGSNNFGDKGAKSLSFSLPFSNIKLLDISNNHINDDGILDILYTIRKIEPMRALYLWGNKMTHVSLSLIRFFIEEGILKQDHIDIKLYNADDGYKAALYSSSNIYKHRYFCVSDYGHPPMKKISKNPGKPNDEPHVTFMHHIADKELGLPIYGA